MELTRDAEGGAKTIKFSDLTTEELRLRSLVFPEALEEFVKRILSGEAVPR